MAVYDQIAPIYDETRGQEAVPLSRLVLDWLDEPSTLVDIGVGTGLTIPLVEDDGHRVIGVDVSRQMLARARTRCPDASLILADAVRLPFRTGTISRAVALQVFQLLPWPEFLLAEVGRVLQAGGMLLAAPIDVDRPQDIIGRAYWDATVASGGVGTADHFISAGLGSGFKSSRIVHGQPRSRTTTPNEEADRLDCLWGGTAFSDLFRRLPHPDTPVEIDMTIRGVVLAM